MSLPKWPPSLSDEELAELKLQGATYALSNGFCYLPVVPTGQTPPSVPAAAIHAPFALFPTPFPRTLFNHAKSLQQIYNVLYARVASDEEFLDSVLSAETGVGRVDTFVGELWKIWEELRTEGLIQPLQLGIFRSDYLLHDNQGNLSLKQVEFNTISASFGALSQGIDGLHRHVLLIQTYANLPPNDTLEQIVQGLVQAHKAYISPESPPNTVTDFSASKNNIRILFVVQPNERNVFDQRFLEYELLKRHGIHVIRRTFDELETQATLQDSDGSRKLLISSRTSSTPIEISVVYFRAGYTPTDYPTPTQFETRKKLERSRAIKCPSIALQLAGSKKIQAVLSNPGVAESFLFTEKWDRAARDSNPHSFCAKDVDALRESWMDMWGLEEEGGVESAKERAMHLVLKPQREGGGNNVYKASILPFLDTLNDKEKEAWIAMELIRVPAGVQNWLVRSGSDAVKANVVSELGIFGWALFGSKNNDGKLCTSLQEGSGGYLLRTKGEDSDEGGVATGFSVLDSVILTGSWMFRTGNMGFWLVESFLYDLFPIVVHKFLSLRLAVVVTAQLMNSFRTL
ncbi:hypothetical protein FRC17_001563 [Serendipita sp. 399]|nr:hypothetical protein FRC17_001563 [Serendipita sp. 399]